MTCDSELSEQFEKHLRSLESILNEVIDDIEKEEKSHILGLLQKEFGSLDYSRMAKNYLRSLSKLFSILASNELIGKYLQANKELKFLNSIKNFLITLGTETALVNNILGIHTAMTTRKDNLEECIIGQLRIDRAWLNRYIFDSIISDLRESNTSRIGDLLEAKTYNSYWNLVDKYVKLNETHTKVFDEENIDCLLLEAKKYANDVTKEKLKQYIQFVIGHPYRNIQADYSNGRRWCNYCGKGVPDAPLCNNCGKHK
jgi:hypothetical protein